MLEGEQRSGAVGDAGGAPLLEPARLVTQGCRLGGDVVRLVVGVLCCDDRLVLVGGETAGVGGEEEQPEVGVALVAEDVVEVELNVGLLGQRGGVPQHAQQVTVGDHPPQAVVLPVEVVLQHRLRCAGRDAGGAGVQGDAGADELQRYPHLGVGVGGPAEAVGDGEVGGLALAQAGWDVEAGGEGGGSAPPELVEQREQPPVAGEGGGGVSGWELVQGGGPGAVRPKDGLPRAGDGGVDGHAGRQLVGRCGLAGHFEVDGAGEGFGG